MKEGRALILIADDVKEIRDLLRFTLQRNYDVIVARNGEEAWELFNAFTPDLVISDVVMPRINGLDLAKKIKPPATPAPSEPNPAPAPAEPAQE